MDATPDAYRADITRTNAAIRNLERSPLTETDAILHTRLVQQLATLEQGLARAEAAYVACPECRSPMRKTHTGGGKRRQVAWICRRAEAEVSTDERGHQHRAPDAVHAYTRVWTASELAE